MSENIFLVADSGGSKTNWRLITSEGDILYKYTTDGMASVNAGVLPVSEIVRNAFEAFSHYDSPDGIYVSLGGPNSEEVKNALLLHWNDVKTDVERESNGNAILYSASFLGCTSVVMCGTGSVAVGLKNGKRCYSGGWGPLYGDGGSGGGLGTDALKMFLRYIDGMENIGRITEVFEFLTDGLNIDNYDHRMELKKRALELDRKKLASFAPMIYKLAFEKDEYAVRLYKKAANEVALLANSVCDNDPETNVMLCGGLFANKPLFVEYCRDAFYKINKASLQYNIDFSPIIAAEINVLKNNGVNMTPELFNKIFNEERGK